MIDREEMRAIAQDALARGQAWLDGKEEREKRERLRDTFAAAALTGLLHGGHIYDLSVMARQAYENADAMLRERERNGAVAGCETVQSDTPTGVSGAWAAAANQQQRERGHYGSSFPYVQGPRSTNHDAAPAATARTDADRDRTDKAATRHGDGTGSIPDSRTRDIVARLRRWCHAVDAESAQDLMDAAADEIERLRIRDYEREAIAAAAESVKLDDDSNWTTLVELLERTK